MLAFFAELGVRSEEEVRSLPKYKALNEQEAVLALQDSLMHAALLPGGSTS